jgi:hypothetical protein
MEAISGERTGGLAPKEAGYGDASMLRTVIAGLECCPW